MPRYVVERTFPDGLAIRDRNTDEGVTWLHSLYLPDIGIPLNYYACHRQTP